KQIALRKKEEYAKKLQSTLAAEIVPFQKFWIAEDYHQNFEKLNPNHPYIKNVSQKRIEQFKQTCPLLDKANAKEVINQINKNKSYVLASSCIIPYIAIGFYLSFEVIFHVRTVTVRFI